MAKSTRSGFSNKNDVQAEAPAEAPVEVAEVVVEPEEPPVEEVEKPKARKK